MKLFNQLNILPRYMTAFNYAGLKQMQALLNSNKLEGGFGRYIKFIERTTNSYRGEIIPGKEGFIDCEQGGGGSSYLNKDYGSGS